MSTDWHNSDAGASADADNPLVSVIVRSMGRPELRGALESLANQDYPSLEVVVVDATGGGHPPLPPLAWRSGHQLRLVGGERRLTRPVAANVGLRAARGQWLMVLDDDDSCDPEHVSTYAAATKQYPDALLLYGTTRFFGPDGRLRYLWGMPFNPAQVHVHPLFCWQAAIFNRRVVDLGCAFDEVFEICEDRDFVLQVAAHARPVQIEAVTFNFRPDLGTSGTGRGSNWDPMRMLAFDQRLKAKWAGARVRQQERAQRALDGALRAEAGGDRAGAQALLQSMLAEFRDDPRALHGLALFALDAGELDSATGYAEQAVKAAPGNTEYRATLARVRQLLQRSVTSAAVGRNDPCPCGSGLRYKACHGASVASAPLLDSPMANASQAPTAPVAPSAIDLAVARGDVPAAMRLLDTVAAAASPARGDTLAAAHVLLAMGATEQALQLLGPTLRQHDDLEVRALVNAGLERRWRPIAEDSCRRQAAALLATINARAQGPGSALRRIALIGDLRHDRPAREASRCMIAALHGAAELRRMSTHATEGDDLGTIASLDSVGAAGESCDVAVWLVDDGSPAARIEALRAARLVLCLPTDSPEAVVRLLTRIEATCGEAEVRITVPGASARSYANPGVGTQYPWIVPPAAAPAERAGGNRGLVLGRLSAGAPTEHALSDLELYRNLLAGGHRIRLHDGAPAAALFVSVQQAPGLELLREHEQSPGDFLASLDVYLYGRGLQAARDGDAKLLTAMAAGRAVVVFAQALESPELVVPGKTGFVVASNAEAVECIGRLAAEPALLRAMGNAARMSVMRLMAAQRERVRAFIVADRAALISTPA